MIKGACHCGAISFEVSITPEWLTQCNCSICRRIGALWCHADISEVTIHQEVHTSTRYIQGDKSLAVHTCNTCGCTTHWENLKLEAHSHMAVNFRMCSNEEVARFTIRHFDGADTWKYAD